MGQAQSTASPPAISCDHLLYKCRCWSSSASKSSSPPNSRLSSMAIRNVAFRLPLLLTAMFLQSYVVTVSTAQSNRNLTVPRKSNTFVPTVPNSYQSELVTLSIRGVQFRLPKAYLFSYGPEYYDLSDGDDIKEFGFRLKWPQMKPIVTNGGDPDIRPYSGNVIVVRGLRFGRLEVYQPMSILTERRKSFEDSLGSDEVLYKKAFEDKTQLREPLNSTIDQCSPRRFSSFSSG